MWNTITGGAHAVSTRTTAGPCTAVPFRHWKGVLQLVVCHSYSACKWSTRPAFLVSLNRWSWVMGPSGSSPLPWRYHPPSPCDHEHVQLLAGGTPPTSAGYMTIYIATTIPAKSSSDSPTMSLPVLTLTQRWPHHTHQSLSNLDAVVVVLATGFVSPH